VREELTELRVIICVLIDSPNKTNVGETLQKKAVLNGIENLVCEFMGKIKLLCEYEQLAKISKTV
jgi:hypothetical protein